jgi:outer membrane protein assembly factor BamB
MTSPIDRRDALLSLGGLLVAGTVSARASSGGRGLPAPPLVRNTGTIASRNVPRTLWKRTADDMLRGVRYTDGRALVLTLSSLSALDASTGRPLWSIPLYSTVTQFGATIADGTFYICGSLGDSDVGSALAIDCATGRVVWTYDAPADVALNGVSGPLNGSIYVTVWDTAAKQRQIWAIDTGTKAVRWKSPCASQDSTDVYAPAGSTRVFNCDNTGFLAAFDATSGKDLWRASYPCCYGSQGPTGKTLISSNFSAVAGLNASTGARVWTATPAVSSVTQVFASTDDAYYLWTGANFKAYQAGNRGTELWSAALNPGDLTLSLNVGFDDNYTMFAATTGNLFAVDTRTGGCRWQYLRRSNDSTDLFDAPLAAGGGYCIVGSAPLSGNTVTALAVA